MADSVEAFLNRLHHPILAPIDLSLERIERFLSVLGSPQRRLPPVIHVAGTNGKGSLVAYLHAIFEAAGYRVHRYTSPHLVHFRERIVLAGKEIENAYLENILKHVAPMLSSYPVTFFEATTAVAFLAFAEKKADVLLMETGMGGRLDATNVVEKPALTAITPIALDHCKYLGDTVPAIAAEKAGILKRGVSCVVGKQEKAALDVIEAKAREFGVPLQRYGQEWECRWQEKDAVYHSQKGILTFTPSLPGKHQYDNAATAIACVEQLPQFAVGEAQILQGLASAVWPARLQKLTRGRYAGMLGGGMELWLDGGHNPQGGEVLAEWLKERQDKEIHLVCGMVNRKDVGGYLRAVAPYVKSLTAVAIPDETTSMSAEDMRAAAENAGIAATAAPSIENALQSAVHRAKTPALILICGSLYLAGKVLATNEARNQHAA